MEAIIAGLLCCECGCPLLLRKIFKRMHVEDATLECRTRCCTQYSKQFKAPKIRLPRMSYAKIISGRGE